MDDDAPERVGPGRDRVQGRVRRPPRRGDDAERVRDRAREEAELEHERQGVADVAVVDVDRGEPRPERGARDHEQDERERERDPRERRADPVREGGDDQHGDRQDEVEHPGEGGGQREHLAWEVDLPQESLVRDEALARRRGGAREEGPAGHAGEGEEEVRDALAREVGVPAEEEREDEGGEHGLDHRPADADRRLLVAHLHLAQDEGPEDLPELPELAEGLSRQPARPSDDLEDRHCG